MNKLVSALALAASFATAGFAQVVDNPEQYTSGAAAPATPNVTINHVESDEPMFAISLHPVTMIVWSLFLDKPSIYVTIEGNINSRVSVITRPYYLGYEDSDEDESLDINLFGISEGVRYYFNRGHHGLFTAFHVSYDYATLEYSYGDDSRVSKSDRHDDVKANGLGLGFYLGSKEIWGHFTTSWDIGLTYTNWFAKSSTRNDVDDISDVGVGIDFNYTIGFTL